MPHKDTDLEDPPKEKRGEPVLIEGPLSVSPVSAASCMLPSSLPKEEPQDVSPPAGRA